MHFFSAVVEYKTPQFLCALFVIFCVLYAKVSLADSEDQEISVDNAALSPTWLRLTHLEKSDNGRYKTDISSQDFYLSHAPFDPLSELNQTLVAFNSPQSSQSNHAVCKFPARYYWLKKTIPSELSNAPDLSNCSELNKWPALHTDNALHLVHVSGYLGNPGSAFGHLLLRVGKKSDANTRGLLDTGINFGARIPPKENTLAYIFKGVMGGYGSSFSTNRHYLRDHVYAATEARDMWAYELNLSKPQTQLLLLHLWELRETNFSYYFLRKNCAWRIAELLELALNRPILPKSRPYYLPVDVFHSIDDLNVQLDQKLIANIRFLPSNKREIIYKYENLHTKTQQAVDRQINNPDPSRLDQSTSKEGLDFLLDYSNAALVSESDQPRIKQWTRLRNKALLLRLNMPVSDSKTKSDTYKAPPPGQGLRHQTLSIESTYSRNEPHKISVSFAPFSYELLDRNRGSVSNGVFRGGALTLSHSENTTKLDSLTILEVARLHKGPSLPKTGTALAWRGGVELNRQWRSDPGRLAPQFNAAVGKTLKLGSTSLYALLEVTANLRNIKLQSGPAIGLVSLPNNKKWSYSWESKLLHVDGLENSITRHSIETRYRLSSQHAINLSAEYEETTRWRLAYQYRW